MDTLISKEDVEFINYFACLPQCNALEVADLDCIWMKMLMENFASGGHLKLVISKQASILELLHGNIGAMTTFQDARNTSGIIYGYGIVRAKTTYFKIYLSKSKMSW